MATNEKFPRLPSMREFYKRTGRKREKTSPPAERDDSVKIRTYFLFSKSQHAVKIGRTKDLNLRLRHLRTGCPDFTLIGAVNADLEEQLHEAFKDLRIHGELFRPEGRLAEMLLHKFFFHVPEKKSAAELILPSDPVINFGLVLMRIREKGFRGLSDAAAHCGTSNKNFLKLSEGKIPRLDALWRICRGLDISEEQLFKLPKGSGNAKD